MNLTLSLPDGFPQRYLLLLGGFSGKFKAQKVYILLQPLQWCCVDCVIYHEQDVREEQKYIYVARTSNNRVTTQVRILVNSTILLTCLSL